MARFCIAGCGTELKKPDGSTDYKKQFCSPTCRNQDKTQRMRDMRTTIKKQDRCPKCGQVIPKEKKSRAVNA